MPANITKTNKICRPTDNEVSHDAYNSYYFYLT
jgi:hypothetical protein